MAERITSKRVFFPKGKQKNFIQRTEQSLKLDSDELAQLLGVSGRTVRDWKREKFSLSFAALRLLLRKTKLKIPKDITVKEPFWYVLKGSSAGAHAVLKKYGHIGGDPAHRMKKWREWWEKEGRFKKHPIISVTKPFTKPKLSKEFAEFMGIMMGDGGMSKTQIHITLHHIDDLEYSRFVFRLMRKMFVVTPGIYHSSEDSVNTIVISRTELVKHLNKLGLPIGNKIKQGIDIPQWIKRNKVFQISCLRGLVDTDGSVFTHTYKVNKKWYSYKKLCFSSSSPPLLKSVREILEKLGFNPRVLQEVDIRLDSKADMIRYFQIVGSHNQKHLKRYKN